MGLTILEVVLGAVASILITILVEDLRKPHLDIQISDYADKEYENRPAAKARFLYLRLVNKSLPSCFKWMTRETALQCHGWISFHHLDGQNVFGRSMPIRWSGSPEPTPISLMVNDKQVLIIDPARLTLESRVDVPAGEAEVFDVAARFDNEEECYGWSNESYFSDPVWRNPNWRLLEGRYLVSTTVVSAGQKVTKLFRLINDVPQRDFRLEPPLKADKVRGG
jgi:hypothetical protein